jgi:cyclopropane fatty-acyl-phospholipid synthase-like methyltransferase
VALRFLRKKKERFYNTHSSLKYLVKTSAKYFGEMIIFEEALWNTWASLEQSIRSGKPARKADMFQKNAEETERFIMAMHSLVNARGDAEILSDKLDFSRAKTLLDIGSGPGTYPIQFLRKYPNLKITILDLPRTLSITKKVLRNEQISGRIRLVERDYNSGEIPKGFDIAFLSNIIHSESEEANQKLLKKVYRALNPRGKIIIKDHILDSTLTSPAVGAIFSINMLLTTKGRDYSFRELRNWLINAGFEKIRWIRLKPPLTSSLVIGRK